jgi:hypothetical protein
VRTVIDRQLGELRADGPSEAGVTRRWPAGAIYPKDAFRNYPKDAFRNAYEDGADFVCAGMYDFQMVEDVNVPAQDA